TKGDVVAIYAHRNALLVSTIIGVLKAGAVFTILDPAYPAARQIECLRIARPRAFIQIEEAGAVPASLEEFVASINCPRLLIRMPDKLCDDPLSSFSTEEPNVAVD